MKKNTVFFLFPLLAVATLTACAPRTLPGIITITPEMPFLRATPYPNVSLTPLPRTPTPAPVSPTVTPSPSPYPWRLLPQATATLPGPTPTETLLPVLELPTARPFAPSRQAWRGEPTYPADSQPGLRFRVDYDPARWALTEDNFGVTVLAHREIPYCLIIPWSGRGLPAGLQVEHEFRTLGGADFDIHTITREGKLEFIAYVGGDRKIVTGFQVAFQEQEETCIQDAETVLATLRSE